MRISDWSSDVCSSDLKLSIESTLHKGKWVHTTTMSAPRPDVNIIDALKFESLAPREKLVFLSDHSPFDHEFPKIAGGQVPVISLFDEGQNLVFGRSEEHTSELQSLMRDSYAVFCLKKKKK